MPCARPSTCADGLAELLLERTEKRVKEIEEQAVAPA